MIEMLSGSLAFTRGARLKLLLVEREWDVTLLACGSLSGGGVCWVRGPFVSGHSVSLLRYCSTVVSH